MDEERQFRLVTLVFWAIAVASIAFIAVQGFEVFEKINNKYQELGFIEWLIIAVWAFGVFLVTEISRGLCQKFKLTKTCSSEGMAAGMLYVFISAVIFIFVTG